MSARESLRLLLPLARAFRRAAGRLLQRLGRILEGRKLGVTLAGEGRSTGQHLKFHDLATGDEVAVEWGDPFDPIPPELGRNRIATRLCPIDCTEKRDHFHYFGIPDAILTGHHAPRGETAASKAIDAMAERAQADQGSTGPHLHFNLSDGMTEARAAEQMRLRAAASIEKARRAGRIQP